MRFQKGDRYRRSEVEGLPITPIILCVVMSRTYVTPLFEVDTDFKNVFTLKSKNFKFGDATRNSTHMYSGSLFATVSSTHDHAGRWI